MQRLRQPEWEQSDYRYDRLVCAHAQDRVAGPDRAGPEERSRSGEERSIRGDELVTLGQGYDFFYQRLDVFALLGKLNLHEKIIDSQLRPAAWQHVVLCGPLRQLNACAQGNLFSLSAAVNDNLLIFPRLLVAADERKHCAVVAALLAGGIDAVDIAHVGKEDFEAVDNLLTELVQESPEFELEVLGFGGPDEKPAAVVSHLPKQRIIRFRADSEDHELGSRAFVGVVHPLGDAGVIQFLERRRAVCDQDNEALTPCPLAFRQLGKDLDDCFDRAGYIRAAHQITAAEELERRRYVFFIRRRQLAVEYSYLLVERHQAELVALRQILKEEFQRFIALLELVPLHREAGIHHQHYVSGRRFGLLTRALVENR